MSTIKQLAATRRERVGKGAARAVRREGRVPAVIYGGGQAPVSISLDFKETNRLIYAGHFLTTVFAIDVEGETIRAIPRDYQLDVVRDFPVHVDFLRLGEGATVRVEVPVHFINQDKCPGLKAGGVLNIVRHAVEFNVPADKIPDSITVDLAEAKVGDSLHISAVKLPEGAKPVISDRDFTIATIAGTAATKNEDGEAEGA
ncbi:50S ribosomal protein L25/general stress protein Ctc [Rhabdaerophilum calidifontis]|uniref:50S ribosomal protein L25/general stress protein Ctc n=1 Tax=Rhabdaerophilum calidifontis TaxID=2604328 RepID=UPI00123B332D|nr:50S ribosomal protein L25/general stress protein Ctc [Rhabdaerophilum calidifontis]